MARTSLALFVLRIWLKPLKGVPNGAYGCGEHISAPPAVVGRPLDPGVHAPVVHHKPPLPEALVARHLLRREGSRSPGRAAANQLARWHSSSSLSSTHCAASPLRLCGWEETGGPVGIQSCANLCTVVRVVCQQPFAAQPL